jgi:hypothetical protein
MTAAATKKMMKHRSCGRQFQTTTIDRLFVCIDKVTLLNGKLPAVSGLLLQLAAARPNILQVFITTSCGLFDTCKNTAPCWLVGWLIECLLEVRTLSALLTLCLNVT